MLGLGLGLRLGLRLGLGLGLGLELGLILRVPILCLIPYLYQVSQNGQQIMASENKLHCMHCEYIAHNAEALGGSRILTREE